MAVDEPALAAHFAKLTHARDWVDIHVYFTAEDKASTAAMHRVHAALSRVGGVRVFNPVGRPIGPHPKPMFEAHIAHNRAAEAMTFLSEHGEGLSVLVHPNTHDGARIDHTVHCRWVNAPLELVPVW